MASWIEALRLRCGPLTEAASIFAAILGVERDPPSGPTGLFVLAHAIERHLSTDPETLAATDALSELADDRLFIELAGAYFAVLLCAELSEAQHTTRDRRHGLLLSANGFYDPFTALERVLASDDVRSCLAHEVALAEAQARPNAATASAAADASWKLVRARILPRLIGPRFYAALGKDPSELPLCAQPLVGDVQLAFIVREPGRARYVRSDEAAGWKTLPPALLRAGLENLARCSGDARLLRFEAEQGPLVVARTGDGLDASRLLLPGMHDLLAAELGSPFAAAVPHRDALFACSLDSNAALCALRDRAAQDAARAPHAITSGVFAVGPHGSLSWLPA